MSHIRQRGITLTELMLVLAIGGLLITMGLRQYNLYAKEKDYFILKQNTDMLFLAMKQYYQINCRNGNLNPKNITGFNYSDPAASLQPQEFDTSVNEVEKYLDSTWPRTNMVAEDENTYFAQFNPVFATRYQYVCDYQNGTTNQPDCSTPSTILDNDKKNILLWQSQIAVKMRNPTDTVYYAKMAGADCATNKDPSNAIDCDADGVTSGSATYMVWQRLPSFSSKAIRSPTWQTDYRVKIFNLQYSNDPMYESFYDVYNNEPNDNYEYNFYVCGG